LSERRYDAVVFDLLTALIDSWTLWNAAAGSAEEGLRWRRKYLELTYGQGAYRPYEELVAAAAGQSGVGAQCAAELLRRWDELPRWPETIEVMPVYWHNRMGLAAVDGALPDYTERSLTPLLEIM
jgi:2-haloacid dehalogenase